MSSDPRYAELRELLLHVEDGEAGPDDLARLEELLEDPNLRAHFVRYSHLKVALRWSVGDLPATACPVPDDSATDAPNRLVAWWRRRSTWAAMAVAATLLIATAVILLRDNSLATLERTINCQWEGRSFAQFDTVTANEPLRLTSGVAELRIHSGPRLVVAGPAEFEVTGPNRVFLRSGTAVAMVPVGAEGFSIDSPHGRVIDLGTVFGVTVGENTEVHVLEGSVETQRTNDQPADSAVVVQEGKATALGPRGIEEIVFSERRYARVRKVATLGFSTAGDVRFLEKAPASVDAGALVEEGVIQLFRERLQYRLATDLQVNVRRPGTYQGRTIERATPAAKAVVPAGTVVSCYFIHFEGSAAVHGSVRFDQRVIGVIGGADLLAASDVELGGAKTTYGNHNSRIIDRKDSARLSEDLHTIELRLQGPGVDQVRVLVAAE